jgi:alcohol dehydrogenase class IV
MFSYSMHTDIRFGWEVSRRLPEFLREHGIGQRLLMVSDPGVIAAGVVEPVQHALEAAGYCVQSFTQVAPNPRDTDCETGVEVFREFAADAVIGIGGGSAMDTAKTIALLAAGGGSVRDYAEAGRPYAKVAPIICLPTTAGTGSEVTRSAVITETATHRKLTLKHARLRPALAVLDPVLTLTVPAGVTAATGVDALVHAIEGYTCKLSSPITRALGARAMREIPHALPHAVTDGRDSAARTTMLEASLLAGLCFGSADVAAVHCLAEALGGLYDTPHGVANAIFLPHVLRFNAEADVPLHAEIARLMRFATDADTDETAVAKLLEGIATFTRELGIPTLRDLGYVQPCDFDELARLAFANGSTPSNVRPITEADYRRIVEAAYQDGT